MQGHDGTLEQQEILDAIASAGQDLAVLHPATAQVLRSVSEADGHEASESTEQVVVTVGCRCKLLSGATCPPRRSSLGAPRERSFSTRAPRSA